MAWSRSQDCSWLVLMNRKLTIRLCSQQSPWQKAAFTLFSLTRATATTVEVGQERFSVIAVIALLWLSIVSPSGSTPSRNTMAPHIHCGWRNVVMCPGTDPGIPDPDYWFVWLYKHNSYLFRLRPHEHTRTHIIHPWPWYQSRLHCSWICSASLQRRLLCNHEWLIQNLSWLASDLKSLFDLVPANTCCQEATTCPPTTLRPLL